MKIISIEIIKNTYLLSFTETKIYDKNVLIFKRVIVLQIGNSVNCM